MFVYTLTYPFFEKETPLSPLEIPNQHSLGYNLLVEAQYSSAVIKFEISTIFLGSFLVII